MNFRIFSFPRVAIMCSIFSVSQSGRNILYIIATLGKINFLKSDISEKIRTVYQDFFDSEDISENLKS